tara:strand:- start:35 stop:508 length:474 start_codon:yes stop_codon:yes gene_type:complete
MKPENITCSITELMSDRYGYPSAPDKTQEYEGYSLSDQKAKLIKDVEDICKLRRIQYYELMKSRTKDAQEARMAVCVIAHDRLSCHMSSKEIADFLNFVRSTFATSLTRWRVEHYGEASVRNHKPGTLRGWSSTCRKAKETKVKETKDSQPKKSQES